MDVRLPNGTVIRGIPEGTPKDVIMAKAVKAGLVEGKTDFGKPVVKDGQFQIGGRVDIGEPIAGAVEPALAIGSGMAADVVGNIGGGIQQAISDNPLAGVESAERIKQSLTYQPRSATAQSVLQRYAEFLEPVSRGIEKTRLGDEALQAGYPEWLAQNLEGIPEFAGAALAGTGLIPKKSGLPPVAAEGKLIPMAEKAAIKSALINKIPDPRAAMFKLSKGKVVSDPLAKTAARQGWSGDVINITKTVGQNLSDKKNALKMIMITRRAKKNPIWGADNRPTDVVGDAVMKRFDYLKKVNQAAGQQVDKVARSLKGSNMDTPFFDQFKQAIDELGGAITEKGKLQFGVNSQLYKQASNQKALQAVMDKINALGPTPDAYDLHKLKQFISEFVDFQKAGGKGGISGIPDKLLKGLRFDINESLKGISNPYDKVNTTFADTKGALNALGDAFGKNIYGPNAEQVTGTTMRRWVGNAVSRTPIRNAVKQADTISMKYGAQFTDDPASQILFANALDDLLTTPFTRTTFKAEGGKVVKEALDRSTLHHIAEGIDAGVNKLLKVSDEKALDALENLIRDAR